jgi:hypothetical protein
MTGRPGTPKRPLAGCILGLSNPFLCALICSSVTLSFGYLTQRAFEEPPRLGQCGNPCLKCDGFLLNL